MKAIYGFLLITVGIGSIVYIIKEVINGYRSEIGWHYRIFFAALSLLVAGIIMMIQAFR